MTSGDISSVVILLRCGGAGIAMPVPNGVASCRELVSERARVLPAHLRVLLHRG
jgi:hypothetical protein